MSSSNLFLIAVSSITVSMDRTGVVVVAVPSCRVQRMVEMVFSIRVLLFHNFCGTPS